MVSGVKMVTGRCQFRVGDWALHERTGAPFRQRIYRFLVCIRVALSLLWILLERHVKPVVRLRDILMQVLPCHRSASIESVLRYRYPGFESTYGSRETCRPTPLPFPAPQPFLAGEGQTMSIPRRRPFCPKSRLLHPRNRSCTRRCQPTGAH